MRKAHRICIIAVLILLIPPFALAQTAQCWVPCRTMGSRPEQQPFGLTNQAANGGFSFDNTAADPTVTMRVVSEDGKELYKLPLSRSQLTPSSK